MTSVTAPRSAGSALLYALAAACAGGALLRAPDAVLALKLLLLAPLIEELFFRAVVQRRLLAWLEGRGRSPSIATATTALAFGAAHLVHASPLHALAVIAPAWAIGCVYERTRALAPCIALHAVFNAFWLTFFAGR